MKYWPPYWICCDKWWLCLADVVLRCRVKAVCDAHDRWITEP